ncbi:DUF418 domain-containing protein [Herbiconiux sp. P15]|uniref:DUF418 domain-containing protein n=1 Tax=Herbiconiux liukaitaii TaxID=3342799 RepID=UPI0035B8DE3F
MTAPARRRILGLDTARGLALLGMLAAHTVPEGEEEALWDGRSSVLFALVAGISLGLLAGGTRRPLPGTRARTARIVALRALLLIILGIALTLLETPIAIILDTYGFLFAVAIPLLFAPRWLLGVVAALSAVVGPPLVTWLSDAANAAESTGGPAAQLIGSPWAYFPEAWLYGVYPAPVWLAYIATGILIARCDLRRRRTQVGMLVTGAVLAAIGYLGGVLRDDPVIAHTNTTAEVVATGGLAVAVVGLVLLVTAPGESTRARWARVIAHPVAAAGSMPLTLYTAQIVVIAIIVRTVPGAEVGLDWQTTPLFFALAVPALAVATLWSLRFEQGPLEWLFSRLSTQRPWRAPTREPSAPQE